MPNRHRRDHLRLIHTNPSPSPDPGHDQPGGSEEREARTQTEQRAAAALASRTRDSLDGFSVDDIDTLAERLREQLQDLDHRASIGTATPDDAATAAALRTALTAHEQVLDWMIDTDTAIYHGQLR